MEILVNNTPCKPNPIIGHILHPNTSHIQLSFDWLLMGICEGLEGGQTEISFKGKTCTYTPDRSNHLHVDTVFYTINEVNVRLPCSDQTESIYNIITRNGSSGKSSTMKKPWVVAGFVYNKIEAATAVQIILTTTAAIKTCLKMYVTFNGYECNPAIDGTLLSTLTGHLHKPSAMFGICSGLSTGNILIELRIRACLKGTELTSTAHIGIMGGVQFEASEIRLGLHVPKSVDLHTSHSHTQALKLFNLQHFAVTAKMKDQLRTKIVFNKIRADTFLYLMIGITVGGNQSYIRKSSV